jgi:hypothetical protein
MLGTPSILALRIVSIPHSCWFHFKWIPAGISQLSPACHARHLGPDVRQPPARACIQTPIALSFYTREGNYDLVGKIFSISSCVTESSSTISNTGKLLMSLEAPPLSVLQVAHISGLTCADFLHAPGVQDPLLLSASLPSFTSTAPLRPCATPWVCHQVLHARG